jgi:hypothetical protein
VAAIWLPLLAFGHCGLLWAKQLWHADRNVLQVRLGAWETEGGEYEVRSGVWTLVHEKWDPVNFDEDIALILLDKNATKVPLKMCPGELGDCAWQRAALLNSAKVGAAGGSLEYPSSCGAPTTTLLRHLPACPPVRPPAAEPDPPVKDGTMVSALGWGATSENGYYADILQEVSGQGIGLRRSGAEGHAGQCIARPAVACHAPALA